MPTNVLSGAAGHTFVVFSPMWTNHLMSTKMKIGSRYDPAQNIFAVMAFPVALHSSV